MPELASKDRNNVLGIARRLNLHVLDMHTVFSHIRIPYHYFRFEGMHTTMRQGIGWSARKYCGNYNNSSCRRVAKFQRVNLVRLAYKDEAQC